MSIYDDVEASNHEVVIVGGCGRVGLPLGVALATTGLRVSLLDIDEASVLAVNEGRLPFREDLAAEPLSKAVSAGLLSATSDRSVVASSSIVLLTVGTSADDGYLTPDQTSVPTAIGQFSDYLRDGQLMVLRSTICPGQTAAVERQLTRLGRTIDLAICPERIAEGHAMTELVNLPQIVAARTQIAQRRAADLFRRITPTIVLLQPEEAELAKLFTNAWRYVKFAIANQFYMLANDAGVDFERVRHAIRFEYPRASDLPSAGFAAGPCLPKDTMHLCAFGNDKFTLGEAALAVNEGLPSYVVSRLEQRYDLSNQTVGILGMAFKAECDDIRESLGFGLRGILELKARNVLCTDPYSTDLRLSGLEDVLRCADLLIVAAPHALYRDLCTATPIVDIWGLLGRGVRI